MVSIFYLSIFYLSISTTFRLNEGFATYMAALAGEKKIPQLDLWSDFVFLETFDVSLILFFFQQLKALELDSLNSSHPIQVEVSNSAEIGEIFDAISYSKGGSVIRMLSEFIGEKAFRSGLHDYLSRFSYQNTSTEVLFNFAFEHF